MDIENRSNDVVLASFLPFFLFFFLLENMLKNENVLVFIYRVQNDVVLAPHLKKLKTIMAFKRKRDQTTWFWSQIFFIEPSML